MNLNALRSREQLRSNSFIECRVNGLARIKLKRVETMEDREYSGKHVVVTGGGSGIGRALALAFAAEGAEVTITDIDQQRVDAVLEELRQTGVKASGHRVDHSSEEETRLFADNLLAATAAPDVVCANAGVAEGSPLESPRKWPGNCFSKAKKTRRATNAVAGCNSSKSAAHGVFTSRAASVASRPS